MKVSVGADSKKVEKALKAKGKDVSSSIKKALSITAQEGINIIENRTARGLSITGRSFKSYSEKYAKFRRGRGRTEKPDLQLYQLIYFMFI